MTEIVAMIMATLLAVVLVLVVKNDGMFRMYIDSSLVEEKVMQIDDSQLLNNIISEQSKGSEIRSMLVNEMAQAEENFENDTETYQNAVQKLKEHDQLFSVLSLTNKYLADDNIKSSMSSFRSKHLDNIDALIEGDKIFVFSPLAKNYVFPIQLLLSVVLVTVFWLVATFVSKPVDEETLRKFYRLTHPGGPGWKRVIDKAKSEGVNINEKEEGQAWEMPKQLLMVFLGCVAIYAVLFAIGGFIYGEYIRGLILALVAAVSTVFLFRILSKLRVD